MKIKWARGDQGVYEGGAENKCERSAVEDEMQTFNLEGGRNNRAVSSEWQAVRFGQNLEVVVLI